MANHIFSPHEQVPIIYPPRLIQPTIYTPRGQLLLHILQSEFNNIRFDDNNVVISNILQVDTVSNLNSTMRFLGKIAEAAIVKRCADYLSANKIWLSIAGLHGLSDSNAKNCIPLGTGLAETKKTYYYHYAPNDPQYDIIWCNSSDNHQLILKNVSPLNGLYAGEKIGLQIKTKTSYTSVLNDLKNKKYSVPLVYIDINGDFEQLIDRIQKDKLEIDIDKEIFTPKIFDPELYEEVQDFGMLLFGVFSGHYSANILLNELQVNKILKSASKNLVANMAHMNTITTFNQEICSQDE